MDNNQSDKELTLDVVISSLIRFVKESLGLIWLFLILFLLLASFFLIKTVNSPDQYLANRTFILNEEFNGAGISGGISSALEGIPFGLGTRTNNNKIIKIAKSNRVLFNVLLDSTVVGSDNDLIANHLIDIYNFSNEWVDDSLLMDFKFENNKLENFTLREVSALKILANFLVEGLDNDPLISLRVDDETEIFSLETVTLLDELSIKLSDVYFKELSSYYEENKTTRQLNTFKRLSYKTDSIYSELLKYEILLAEASDKGSSIILNKNRRDQARYKRQVDILSLMYAESLKNTEVARFIYQRAIPYFEVIDTPKLPLEQIGESKFKAVLLSVILTLILGTVIIFAKIFTKDILIPSWKRVE